MRFRDRGLLICCVISGAAGAQSDLSSAQTAFLTDTQIARIVVTINDGEIETGRLARERAQNKEVKDFAETLISDQTQNNLDISSSAKNSSIDSEISTLARNFGDESKIAAANLAKKDKDSFDKAYMAQQIAMQTEILNSFNQKLIPSAQNAELKSVLKKSRDAVVSHLARAKEIQSDLQ